MTGSETVSTELVGVFPDTRNAGLNHPAYCRTIETIGPNRGPSSHTEHRAVVNLRRL